MGQRGRKAKTKKETKTDGEIARDATKAVNKQTKLVEKLLAEKDELSKRVKANRDALRLAEEELDNLKSQARKAARIVAKQDAEKYEEKLKVKISKASSSKSAVNRSVDCSKQRLEDILHSLKSAQKKAKAAKSAILLVKKKFDSAEKACKELREKGEEVPDENDYKDLSAPGAWKPEGVLAAKARDKLKAELAKKTALLEKAEAEVAAKENKQKIAETRLEEIKKKRKIADEKKRELTSELAGISDKSARKRKAVAKPRSKAMKVLKKPGKA